MEIKEVTEKECLRCGKTKALTEFHVSRIGKYGRKTYCKECESKKAHDYWLRKKKQKETPKEKIASGVSVFKKLAEKTMPAGNPPPAGEAQKLADEHWDYVRSVLETHFPDEDNKEWKDFEFHYKTAFVHGYKHGRQAKQ